MNYIYKWELYLLNTYIQFWFLVYFILYLLLNFPMFLIMPYNDYTKKFIGGNLSRPDFYYSSRSLPDILQNMKDHPEDYKEINDDIRYSIKYTKNQNCI